MAEDLLGSAPFRAPEVRLSAAGSDLLAALDCGLVYELDRLGVVRFPPQRGWDWLEDHLNRYYDPLEVTVVLEALQQYHEELQTALAWALDSHLAARPSPTQGRSYLAARDAILAAYSRPLWGEARAE